MKPSTILSLMALILCGWSASVSGEDAASSLMKKHYHKDVLIKMKVDNLSSQQLTPQEIDFMDQVWKDAYLSVAVDEDIAFDYVDLESQESSTPDRKLWYNYRTPRYSYSSVYGFRFNYWCDLCWDDRCWWGYRRNRALRGSSDSKKKRGMSSSKKTKKKKS